MTQASQWGWNVEGEGLEMLGVKTTLQEMGKDWGLELVLS